MAMGNVCPNTTVMSASESSNSLPEITRELLLAIKPFHITCKLFGLMPFTVDMNTGSVKKLKSDLVTVVLASISHLISVCLLVYFHFRLLHTTVEVISVFTEVSLCALSFCSIIMDVFWHTEKYEKIIKLIVSCDRVLTTHIGPVNSHDGIIIKMQLFFLISYVSSLFTLYFTLSKGEDHKLGMICMVGGFISVALCLLRFVNLQFVIRYRASLLNVCVREMRSNTIAPCFGKVSVNNRYPGSGSLQIQHRVLQHRSGHVRSLTRVYVELCELSELAASVHDVYLILVSVGFSLATIIHIYFLITKLPFLGATNMNSWQGKLSIFLMLVYLLLLVTPTHWVETEARRTRRLCCQLLLRGRQVGGAAHRELWLLSRQVASRRPVANLLGVLTLRLNLITGFVSVVTTYTALFLTFWPSGAAEKAKT